jgi:hypothetical protein
MYSNEVRLESKHDVKMAYVQIEKEAKGKSLSEAKKEVTK